jgi:hypothetical protein
MRASRGQVGAGSLVVDDTTGTMSIPAMKTVTVTESADTSDTTIFRGYTAERSIRRGPLKVAAQRQWLVKIEDVNAYLDDILITGDAARRNGETDVERVLWLLSSSGALDLAGVGHVPSSNTVQMDAVDYRGAHPRRVLEDCAQKSGKNFFLYYTTSGGLDLFYDLDTGTNLTSTLRISDDPADVDSSTTFAPDMGGGDTLEKDPTRVYSRVRVRYKKGACIVRKAATETTFRQREKSVTNMRVKTRARAEELANKQLDLTDTEQETIGMSIHVPAAKVNDLIAGMRVQVKLRHAGYTSFTWFRCIARTVRMRSGSGEGASDVAYTLDLEFADRVRPTKFQDRSGNDQGEEVDEEMSNATDDDANVIIDSGGITVENGAITVTNSNGTVIIDGSTDFLSLIRSGTFVVPRNTSRGDKVKSVTLNTGLTYNPVVMGAVARDSNDGHNWRQMLPLTVHNLSGQVLEYYGIRGRASGSKTVVQGIKGSTRPPLGAKTFRYYVFKKDTI